MSTVFISYKREDETRVARLVKALEAEDFDVWWDQNLPQSENWRVNIEKALDGASCVVVVWTKDSVSPAGSFVRDEASRGKARGILVPVFFDKVSPPLGFGEIQTVDLRHWRGSSRDPFFKDLCATIQAKLDNKPAPRPKGPLRRLQRRITYSSVSFFLIATLVGFGLNLFGAQQTLCTLLPTAGSDACGALGLGNQPTKAERLSWAQRTPGSCEDLQHHLTLYPTGAYATEAQSLLDAVDTTHVLTWEPLERTLSLFVRQQPDWMSNTEAAQSDALDRGTRMAAQLCQNFGAGDQTFRYLSGMPEVQSWNCDQRGTTAVCGFEGQAVCSLEARRVDVVEVCGTSE